MPNRQRVNKVWLTVLELNVPKLNKGLKGCGLFIKQHMCWKGLFHFMSS